MNQSASAGQPHPEAQNDRAAGDQCHHGAGEQVHIARQIDKQQIAKISQSANLTQKGRQTVDTLRAVLAETIDEILGPIGDDKKQQLQDLLRGVAP